MAPSKIGATTRMSRSPGKSSSTSGAPAGSIWRSAHVTAIFVSRDQLRSDEVRDQGHIDRRLAVRRRLPVARGRDGLLGLAATACRGTRCWYRAAYGEPKFSMMSVWSSSQSGDWVPSPTKVVSPVATSTTKTLSSGLLGSAAGRVHNGNGRRRSGCEIHTHGN
jgi:hypothetical protein